MALQVSVGQVKRDLAELINKVAYGGERIVVTSQANQKLSLLAFLITNN